MSQVSIVAVPQDMLLSHTEMVVWVQKLPEPFCENRLVDPYSLLEKVKMRLQGKKMGPKQISLFRFRVKEVLWPENQGVVKMGSEIYVYQPSSLGWIKAQQMRERTAMDPSFLQSSYRPGELDNRFESAPEQIIVFLKRNESSFLSGQNIFSLAAENAWEPIDRKDSILSLPFPNLQMN